MKLAGPNDHEKERERENANAKTVEVEGLAVSDRLEEERKFLGIDYDQEKVQQYVFSLDRWLNNYIE